MEQQYAGILVEVPENEEKKSLHQEQTYEIEYHDIKNDYTVKF